MNEAHIFMSRALFVGFLPTIFIIISAFIALRWYRSLLPVVIGLALYLAVCLIVFFPVTVPEGVDLMVFGVALPLLLAILGSVWVAIAAKRTSERIYGIGISLLGFALVGANIFIFIRISWAGI